MIIREATFQELFDADNFDDLARAYTLESGTPIFGNENVDVDWYLAGEQAGQANLIIAEKDEHIVGFAVIVDGYHPHFSIGLACLEALYLAPAYRRGVAGIKLIRAAQNLARNKGYRFLTASAPAESRLNALYKRLGEHTDNDYLFDLRD